MYSKPCKRQILHCGYYMVIFGLAILAKHCQFGQAKPGLPQFADEYDLAHLLSVCFGIHQAVSTFLLHHKNPRLCMSDLGGGWPGCRGSFGRDQ